MKWVITACINVNYVFEKNGHHEVNRVTRRTCRIIQIYTKILLGLSYFVLKKDQDVQTKFCNTLCMHLPFCQDIWCFKKNLCFSENSYICDFKLLFVSFSFFFMLLLNDFLYFEISYFKFTLCSEISSLSFKL